MKMPSESNLSRKILIVEDEPDFASLISLTLRGAGYSVTTVHDGDAAMAELSRCVPDLITLDLNMPGKSGGLFYAQMKSRREYSRIPVIVITGLRDSPEADAVIRAYLRGEGRPAPDAYFDKPFNRHELVRTVEYYLRRSPGGANRD